MPSARSATRSRRRSSSARRSRSTSRSTCCSATSTWETSYGLPGEGQPPRVVAHITFDWPTWSQTAYRRWYVDEVLDEQPAIEMEIVFRVQRLAEQPDAGGGAGRAARRRAR